MFDVCPVMVHGVCIRQYLGVSVFLKLSISFIYLAKPLEFQATWSMVSVYFSLASHQRIYKLREIIVIFVIKKN